MFLFLLAAGNRRKVGIAEDPNAEADDIAAVIGSPVTVVQMTKVQPDLAGLALSIVVRRAGRGDPGDWYGKRVPEHVLTNAVHEAGLLCSESPAYKPIHEWADPLRAIRVEIFGLSQVAFGSLAGVSGSKVSRWESGEIAPTLDEIERLRSFAIAAGLPWSDDALWSVSAVMASLARQARPAR